MKRSFFVVLCLLMVATLSGCWSWIFFVDQPSSVDEGAPIDINVALHAAPDYSAMYTPVFCTALPDDWSIGSMSYSFRSTYDSTVIPSTLFAAPDESADMNSNDPVSTGGVLSTWNCYSGLYTTYTGVEVWDINIDAQVGSSGAYTTYYAAYSTDSSTIPDIIEKRTVVGAPAGQWDTWETVNILPDQENRPVPDIIMFDIAYGSGVYVAALSGYDGYEGTLLTAIGGESWLTTALQTHDYLINNVNYSGGYFLATSPDDDLLWMSNDGITWTTTDTGISNPYSAAYNGDAFVVVGSGGETAWSTDGSAWSVTVVGSDDWYEVVYGGGRFVAAGGDGDNTTFMTSTDGQAWTATTLGDPGSSSGSPWTGIAYGDGKYYAVLESNLIFSSNDGSTWETHSLSDDVLVTDVAQGDNIVMVIGINANSEGLVLTSTDGETWTTSHPGTGEWLFGITYDGDGRFYVGGTSLLLIRNTVSGGGKKGGGGGLCNVTAANLDEPVWPGILGVTLMVMVLFFLRRRQMENYHTL